MESRRKPAGTPRRTRRPLGREVWLETARQALIEEGTAGIEIKKIADRLGVSRGGFYWFFEDREQLLRELLAYWVQASTVPFERILVGRAGNGLREFHALIDLWIDEKEYDPRWDAAVRDWARTSSAVLSAVRQVDEKRISILEQVFADMGYLGKEAHVRARITYYHQVGYHALGLRESRKLRLELLPFYVKVLTGREAT
jgi:AcrR family transcriptional regulator